MDLRDGAQAAQRHPNALAEDTVLTDAHVAYAQLAEARLHAFHPLVHIADKARVFPESEQQRILFEERGEVVADNDAAVHFLIVPIFHWHLRYLQAAFGALAIEVAAVAVGISGIGLVDPRTEVFGIRTGKIRLEQGAAGDAHDILTLGVQGGAQFCRKRFHSFRTQLFQ